jgi:hypothetical protein
LRGLERFYTLDMPFFPLNEVFKRCRDLLTGIETPA